MRDCGGRGVQNSSSLGNAAGVVLPATALSINSGSWIHDNVSDTPLIPVESSTAYSCQLCGRLVPAASVLSPTIQHMLERARTGWTQCVAEFESSASRTSCASSGAVSRPHSCR